MLGLTWLKVKFELKLSNQMEKKTKQKQGGKDNLASMNENCIQT